MANCCFFSILAVSPKEESLDKLVNIMKYTDPDWYIYRVRECKEEPIYKSDDLYWTRICGEVAWSISEWVTNSVRTGEENCAPNGAKYSTLYSLSEMYDISFYILAEADDFMEYAHIHNGKVIDYDSTYLHDGEISYQHFEDDVDDALDSIDELDLRSKYPEKLSEFFHAIKRVEGTVKGCLVYRLGGYEYDMDRSASDVYSDRHVVPVEAGVWFEE